LTKINKLLNYCFVIFALYTSIKQRKSHFKVHRIRIQLTFLAILDFLYFSTSFLSHRSSTNPNFSHYLFIALSFKDLFKVKPIQIGKWILNFSNLLKRRRRWVKEKYFYFSSLFPENLLFFKKSSFFFNFPPLPIPTRNQIFKL
jgi:hypothetical protein